MSGQPQPPISIVIPAFNEAERLPSSLAEIDRFCAREPDLLPLEVVVVDDGSRDRTAHVARSFAPASALSCRVLEHPENRGKGAAVRSGFAASNGAQVVLCDADLATPIEELGILRSHFRQDTIVIGSRAVDRRLILTRQPLLRDLMGRVFNGLVQLLVLPGVWDTQCGFKLFPGSAARRLAAAQRLDGFAFDVELLARARRAGLDVREVGVRWHHVEASRVLPGRHSLQMFRDLLRLAAWRITGRLDLAGGR
jgi:dolichyl-phosphate beta-glucosyltransferase